MLRRIGVKFALVLAVALGCSGAAVAQQANSNSPALYQIDPLIAEAQGWLTDLVHINTSPSAAPATPASAHSPGTVNAAPATAGAQIPPSSATAPATNEVAAAKYVAQILQKENIQTELLEVAPGTAVVVGRMQAGPLPNPAQALLLVAHLDVAGVDKSKWSVDPFSATVKDGYIYGRGVLDDKGMLAANLAAMVALRRSSVRLNRDVIFLADAGTDPANAGGIRMLANKFWDRFACGFALNEGGEVHLQDGKPQYVAVGDGEKVPYNISVVASGTPGPASIPGPDDAVTHLAAAIAKIGAMEPPPELLTVTRRYFEQLSAIEDEDTGKWMRALETERFSLAVLRLTNMNPVWGAMLRDTVEPTELEAAIAPGVVPSEARAKLHAQLLPGNPISTLVEMMEKAANDPKVRFHVDSDYGVAAPESALDSPLYQSIVRTAPQQFPGTAVVPMLSPETTGSAELRLRNVQAYGLFPFPLTQADAQRMESDDERLPVTSFRAGVEFLYRTVYDFAASK